jgi:isoleucyl-tRNA synthetase
MKTYPDSLSALPVRGVRQMIFPGLINVELFWAIISEVNVKSIEYLADDSGILVKKVKPNFKTLGPRYGKMMKQISSVIAMFGQDDIRELEQKGTKTILIEGMKVTLQPEDVEITTEDIPGWSVSTLDKLTVALDMTLAEELINEGLARELVNRVQNMRKDLGFDVTDHIYLEVEAAEGLQQALNQFSDYVCAETLSSMRFVDHLNGENVFENELTETSKVKIRINKKA